MWHDGGASRRAECAGDNRRCMGGDNAPGHILQVNISTLTYLGKASLSNQRKVVCLVMWGQLWTEMQKEIKDKHFWSKPLVTPVFWSMEKRRSERENKAAHQSLPAELDIAGEHGPGERVMFMKQTEWPDYSLQSLIFAKNMLYRTGKGHAWMTGLPTKYTGHIAVNWLFLAVGIRLV